MKSLYHCRYRFYKSALAPQKILAISDIHFIGYLTKKQQRVIDFARRANPDLIVVTGDIINNIEAIEDKNSEETFKKYLAELGEIAPVCLCLGNHDSYRHKKVGIKYNYASKDDSKIIDCLKNIPNIHLLKNAFYEDEKNLVFGLSLPPNYYDTPQHPGEKKDVLLKELEKNQEQLKKLPKHKAKFFLVHSPTFLTEPTVREFLNEFDFILAGHMHNGLVPPLLQEAWRGHRGIVTSTKKIFANENTRLGLYDDKFIALGAVVTLPKKGKIFDALFPTYVATIEISHDEPDTHKPSVRRRYRK